MSTNKDGYMRAYYEKNKARILEQNRKYREKDPARHLERAREYHWKNRERLLPLKREHAKRTRAARADNLRYRKYGLSPAQYQAMLTAQNGKCAICDSATLLVVDHDHECGAVRSLLCSPCNTAIGLLKEDRQRMLAAVAYLESHNAMMKAQAVQAKAGMQQPQEQGVQG